MAYPPAMPLDPSLDASLRRLVPELLARGELLSAERIDRYHALFRARFGPEVLAALSGRELLLKMHGRSDARDSLVYWLEFKNDEEFPGPRFGGIGGGSALKYLMYFKRSEPGQWMTGSGTKQEPISEEKAVEIATWQRDELVAGARILDRARRAPAAVDYLALQRDLEAAAPRLHHLGWVHKYFALLAPEVLDDYHAANYQRYYLIKLRLRPLGEALYCNGGLFQAEARALGIPLGQLTTTLNHVVGPLRRYWKIGTTNEDDNTDEWPPMREHGYVALGWSELGDLRQHIGSADLREQLQRLHTQIHPDTVQASRSRAVNQLMRFLRDIEIGDIVLAVVGMGVLGVGEVTGDYSFRAEAGFSHTRAVRWIDDTPWRLPVIEKPRQAVTSIEDIENMLAIEQRLASPAPAPSVSADPPVDVLPTLVAQIAELLAHKPQVILHGPPGTGKSHWAHRALLELAARDWHGRALAALTASERTALTGTDGAIELCTFHPGFGYEDFVEGLRPLVSDSGQLGFTPRDGLFKRLCRRAAARPERRHFLLIDEINRGDLPRIFGELLTLLERDKRGWPLTLALTGEHLVVPANLEIVATMNTADRSIALLDAALRRRFGFLELMPDARALGDAVVLGLPLGPLLDWLNEALLRALGPGLRQLQIGHAYLMHNGQPISDPHHLAMALRNDIVPLLEEYCHEDRKTLRTILGPGLFRGNSLELEPNLFDAAHREDLGAALRAHFADRLGTPEVVALLARAQADRDDA